MSENEVKAAEFAPLLKLAKRAIGSGPDKWEANCELLTWFRSSPVEVIEALQAAAKVSERPGGINHTSLHKTIANIPSPVEKVL